MKEQKQISLKMKLIGLNVGLLLALAGSSVFMMDYLITAQANAPIDVIEKVAAAKKVFYFVFLVITVFGMGLAYFLSNHISKSLTLLTSRIATGGKHVAKASAQISQTTSFFSDASLKQASAIQQTAASVEEVGAMVKKNSENAAQSHVTSQKSREYADEGRQAVGRMIQSISEISESNAFIMNQVTEGNQKISEIIHLIAEIGNKTKVINDIVFQTKLLSFNASVEAARAGEHGKGFAVVAEEVGNLAEMSGNAAKEISNMLSSSIQKVESIISETKSGVERLVVEGKSKVESGKHTAEECGKILSQILSAAEDVDGMVSEIAHASKEQSQGVDEINKAMNELNQITHQNSSVCEQSTVQANELNQESQDLLAVVGELSYLVTGRQNFEFGASEKTPKPASVNAPKMVTKTVAKPTAKTNSKSIAQMERSFVKKVQAKQTAQVKRDVKVTRVDTNKKIAVGGGGSPFPQHDDPRFEDV